MEAGGVNKNLWDVCRHIKYLKFFKAQVTLNAVYRHSLKYAQSQSIRILKHSQKIPSALYRHW